jgi:8-oxo-dGTP diphosphatase
VQHATAAIIQRAGKILLALRRAGKHMGPKWELPGGKVDPGEDPAAALRRELEEEFGVQAQIGEYLGSVRFRNETLDLQILLYRISGMSGVPQLREHEDLRWVEPGQIEDFDLVDSDRLLIRKFRSSLTR